MNIQFMAQEGIIDSRNFRIFLFNCT